MEELISSIKEKISNDGYIKSEDLERFTAQFRERGISVMALEEILNFYMTFHPGSNEIHEEAFVDKRKVSYTSNDILLRKLQEKEYEIQRIKHQLEVLETINKKKTKEIYVLQGVLLLAVIIVIFLIIL